MKLRTTLKIATVTSVILLCIGIAFSLYFRMTVADRAEDFDLYTLVPPNSKLVVDTENMVDLMQRINELNCSKNNHFLYFSRFFFYIKDHINTLLEQTPHGLSKQMSKMLISFHEPNGDSDQVFYCRLGAGDYEFVEQFIRKYFSSSFPSRFFDYRGEEIRIYPMPDDTFLACYVTPRFLVVSFQKKLIEEVIDTRLSKKSILQDTQFSRLRAGRRVVTPATIYTSMKQVELGKESDGHRFRTDIGGWTEFNVNFGNESIYLSGTNHDSDSCATFISMLRELKPVNGFQGNLLPDSTFFFSRGSISNLDRILSFTSRNTFTTATNSNPIIAADNAIRKFLIEYAGNDMTTCMFHSTDTTSQALSAVLIISLRNHSGINQALASLYHAVPQDQQLEPSLQAIEFSIPTHFTAYALPHNTLFSQLTSIIDPSLSTYACIYQDHLIIAPQVTSLQAYIQSIHRGVYVLEGTPFFDDITSTLSPTYNFMIMADMEHILQQPESYVQFIPKVFFRHSYFFSHFMLTTQFTTVDNTVYPYLILTYKSNEK